MTRVTATCFLFALLATSALAAHAAGSAAAIACPRVQFAPTPDGRMDDWPPLPQVVIAGPSDWHPASGEFAEYGGAQDMSAEVSLAWDSQALYLALQTRDDSFVRVRSAAEIDRGDSIVIALAGEGADEVNQFVVALLRAASLVWRAEPAAEAGEMRTIGRAMAVEARDSEGASMVYELAIPWSELKQVRPIAGARLTISVSACDDDGQGLEGCLGRSFETTLVTTGLGPVSARGPARPPAATPSFPSPQTARFDERSFILKGQPVLLIGGEVDYARLPREVWEDRLARLQAAGLNAVGVTVPWAHHQPTSAPAELEDLRAFLVLCKREGLWVQVDVGPFIGRRWEAGGIPGWVIAAHSPRETMAAAAKWLTAVLSVVAEYQLSADGPVAYVLVCPLPDARGDITAAALERIHASVRAAGITAPVASANAPAARSVATQALTDLLDTVSFYQPVSADSLMTSLESLAAEEVGPLVISGLAGDYRSVESARQSMNRVRLALAKGASAVMLSDFAPGFDAATVRTPGDWTGEGVVDAAGSLAPGYGEVRLAGRLVSAFGSVLATAIGSEELVETGDPNAEALVRYGKEQALLFVWGKTGGPHQVRLSYHALDTQAPVSVPEAGAIHVPAGGALALPVDLPLGRALVRYCTSEIASVSRLGERMLLVVYGDVDTPGEIAIRLPGPPLVAGDAARQRWDSETKTLYLDYYHGAADKYLLVDELEIAVLSRERAAMALAAPGELGATLVSAGANVAGAALSDARLQVELHCPPGRTEVTAALPRAPSAVTVDGKPVEFSFATPERVLRLTLETKPFKEERRAETVWQRLGRALVGGPPRVYARFDRGLFMPDAEARGGDCARFESVFGAPEKVGLQSGRFARLKTQFAAAGPTELVMSGSRYPVLVFINGRLVPALSAGSLLSGEGRLPRADITPYLKTGDNDLEIVAQVLPRAPGEAGLSEEDARLPEVRIVTESGAPALAGWQVCPGLAGEAAGFAANELDTRRWHFIRFGPWRDRGRELSEVWGPGWYRVTFDLPRTTEWLIPYYVEADVRGAGQIFAGGRALATLMGDGKCLLPVPASLLAPGEANTVAVALYGVDASTGLYALTVSDEGKMTRRRKLEVLF